ncbi:hypothetical protein RF55_20372 [Lasius niger]|uniref:Uncharacterized protein n=2 Tax=Lasius niger TaxID=67767 RepID=A0A0J7JZ34_LASNI|nr:hypothetical protein RF55_20372 [Lasius niger]
MNIEEGEMNIGENEADVIENREEEAIENNEDMEIDVEVDNEEESSDDEIRILEDSDYDSECNEEEFSEKQVKILKRADVHDIDELQKMCSISFYYEIDNGDKFCTACFLRVNDSFSRARAVRTHETERYVLLVEDRCCECGGSVSQITSCSLCPICKR